MSLGLRTVVYHLEIQPYFDQPFYVGFNIGGHEIDLEPESKRVTGGNHHRDYWGVKDIGGDVQVASGMEPFGKIIGVIRNP